MSTFLCKCWAIQFNPRNPLHVDLKGRLAGRFWLQPPPAPHHAGMLWLTFATRKEAREALENVNEYVVKMYRPKVVKIAVEVTTL